MMFDGWVSKILISLASGIGIVIIIKRFLRRNPPGLCTNTNSLEGRTVIITGANSGIGREVAKDLARRKARVILACKDVEKGNTVAKEIRDLTGNLENVVVKQLDLASFDSIREFCKDIESSEQKLNILVNNAGVFSPPFCLTTEGYEATFAVNHLGHFLLTNLLLKKLEDSAPSRIIIVTSKLYEKAQINFENLNGEFEYKGIGAYKQSKLANLLFAFELNKRLKGDVTVNTLHPGFVATGLFRSKLKNAITRAIYPLFAFLFMRTPVLGAQTVIYLATASEVEGVSGKYFGDCKEEQLKENAIDEVIAAKLWKVHLITDCCDDLYHFQPFINPMNLPVGSLLYVDNFYEDHFNNE